MARHLSNGSFCLGRKFAAYSLAAGTAALGSAAVSHARVQVYDNGGAGWFDSSPHMVGAHFEEWDLIMFNMDGTVLVDDSEIDQVADRTGWLGFAHRFHDGSGFKGDALILDAYDKTGVLSDDPGYGEEYFTLNLDPGDPIEPGQHYGTAPGTPNIMHGYGYYAIWGEWYSPNRGYAGFYFENDDGGRHYGWADVTAGTIRNEVTLHSFGVESAPGYAVSAGAVPLTPVGDFDGDGVVDVDDLRDLEANLGDAAYDLDLDGDADGDDIAFLVTYCFDLPGGEVGTAVGDVNLDGVVNATDLAMLESNFGQTGMTYEQGNLNGDGAINATDLALMAANFGFDATGAGASVPEPVTLSLLALGASGVLASRKRR